MSELRCNEVVVKTSVVCECGAVNEKGAEKCWNCNGELEDDYYKFAERMNLA